MDGLRGCLLLVAALFLSACAEQGGSVSEVTKSFESSKCRTSSAVETEFIVQWKDGHFSVEKGADPESFRKGFVTENIADIQHVQINQKISLVTPISAQSSEFSTQAVDQWGQTKIGASSLWATGYKGQGVKIAVVDSAVDVNHKQLKTRIAINTGEIPNNGIDDDGNGIVDDYYGATFYSNPNYSTAINDHGSHVSGIIAADPTQGSMSGVAPEAQIIPATFLDGDGGGTLGDAILAMQYAVSRGAKIINTSWGGSGCSESLQKVFSEISDRGILIVAAAGNSGLDIDTYEFYPASFNLANQLTVSASDSSELVPVWSNTGLKKSHLTAPGVDIQSLGFNNTYVWMDGTSMAAPFVSGAAAVLWSAVPNATATQVKTAILRGVDLFPGKYSRTLSRGRLNLQKSLDELRRLVP